MRYLKKTTKNFGHCYKMPLADMVIYLTYQHSFVEIDHEMFSRVILSLPLIQEGQLSVSGERMCTILVNRLKDCLPSKRVVT